MFLYQNNGIVSLSQLLFFIFWIFLWFLFMDEWDHLLGLLLTLEVLFWTIILLPYIIIVFYQQNGAVSPSQLLIVILWSFYDPPPPPWMIVTTCWDHIFHSKYFVGRLYYLFIDIMITDSIWSNMLSDLTLLFLFFITNHQNRTKICQVINSHWIKTIKREQTFGKWSIQT